MSAKLTPAEIRRLEIAVEFGSLAGVAEFFDGARVITRVGRGEPVPMDAAYFRTWRAKNPERAKAINDAYRARQLEKDAEKFRASKRASWKRHYQKHRAYYLARAKAQHAASKEAA